MWTSKSVARLAAVVLLSLPAALACGDTGDDAGGSADGGTGGGMPAPGSGGSGGNGDGGGGSGSQGGTDGGGGAKPGPLKIPEWGRNGFLFDDNTDAGKANWAEINDLFIAQCKDGTLCVKLVRVYRTEDGQPSVGPCGYDHVEPAADTWIRRDRTVYVVGVCAAETGGPDESGESGPTGETGTTGEPGESGGSPDDEPSASNETVPTT